MVWVIDLDVFGSGVILKDMPFQSGGLEKCRVVESKSMWSIFSGVGLALSLTARCLVHLPPIPILS